MSPGLSRHQHIKLSTADLESLYICLSAIKGNDVAKNTLMVKVHSAYRKDSNAGINLDSAEMAYLSDKMPKLVSSAGDEHSGVRYLFPSQRKAFEALHSRLFPHLADFSCLDFPSKT